MSSESESTNITARKKRPRAKFSPENELRSFEDKITNMLKSWKSDQDVVLKKLTSNLAEVKQQNENIQATNNEIEKSIEFMNKGYESMRQTLIKLEEEKQEQRIYILELEKKVSDLQRGSRSSAIEIRNVPLNDRETINDLSSIVVQTCNAVQIPLKPTELRDVYRLPGKKGLNRPIVAEFLRVPMKMQVLNATRTFNKGLPTSEKLNTGHIGISGPLLPIYVAEYLPGSSRQLYHEARSYCKTHKFKFCWYQNGKIFLREREGMESICINSAACLKKLLRTE